jgi:hypothetical protein
MRHGVPVRLAMPSDRAHAPPAEPPAVAAEQG